MGSLFLLIGGAILTVPIIAIVALVRTSALRSVLNDRYREYEDTVSDLRREITILQRSLADLSERVTLQSTAVVSPTAEAAVPEPSPPDPVEAALPVQL